MKEKSSVLFKWGISIIIPVLLFFIIPENDVITYKIRMYICITLFTILMWIFNNLPPVITGLVMSLLYIFLNVSTGATVFSSWTNQIVWLCVGGVTIALAFEKTGLMKRIAYNLIYKTGCSYKGIVIGLIGSGIIMTFILPNITARVTMYAALAFGICKSLNIKANTKTAAGIMLSGFLGAISARGMVLSGWDNLVMSYGLIDGYEPPSYISFLLCNIIPTLIWCVLMCAMILILFKQDVAFEGKDYFKKEIENAGKVTKKEWIFLAILVVVVLMMFFSDYEIGWLFLAAACICFFPGIKILENEDIKNINFPIIIFIASAMTIGNVASELELGTLVGNLLVNTLQNMETSNVLMMIIAWAFGVVMNLLMTPVAALSAFSVPIASTAASMGANVTWVLYSFIWGVEQFIFAYEWALFLVVFGYGMFSDRETLKFGGAQMILSFVFMLAILLPCWSLFGFA